jgi:hypothetical protein
MLLSSNPQTICGHKSKPPLRKSAWFEKAFRPLVIAGAGFDYVSTTTENIMLFRKRK